MALTWNIKQLKEDVRTLYGDAACYHLGECAESIILRFRNAHYHYRQAFDFVDTVFDEKQETSALFMRVVNYEGDEQHKRFAAAAHVLACLQNHHAVADTFAHVLYFGLNMGADKATRLRETEIDLPHVFDKLPPASEFRQGIASLRSHEDFAYLDAVVNRAKHRAVVRAGYTVDMTGNARHGLYFNAFSRKGKDYAKTLVSDVLTAEHERQSKVIVDMGVKLNEWVASHVPNPDKAS